MVQKIWGRIDPTVLMKKWEKIVFYEFNIGFALIFRK